MLGLVGEDGILVWFGWETAVDQIGAVKNDIG